MTATPDGRSPGGHALELLEEREAAGGQLVWALYIAGADLLPSLPDAVFEALARAQAAYGVAPLRGPAAALQVGDEPLRQLRDG